MPLQKPTFFTKVLQTLRQLSTTKGFTIKQIADQLRQLGVKRDLKEIKSIVEQSLKYGVKNKLLQEKAGKYHLTVARLRSLHRKSSAQKKKKKHVRFKKNTKSQKRKSPTNSSPKKRGPRSKKQTEENNTMTPSEAAESPKLRNSAERSDSKSESGLKVENKESKEALDVTPEKDVHDNCVNKNRNRGRPPVNTQEPPRLESDPKLDEIEPPRPPKKLIRKTPTRHSSSKVRKELNHKYKHYCSHAVEREKRLKDLIPDDKMYRKYKTCSKHHRMNSEEGSDFDTRSFKEKTRRKCHHCRKGHYHHSHYNLDGYLLERKLSKTIVSHLDKRKTVSEPVVDNLTPFEVFLEANHSKLETIAENMSADDDDVEEVEDKTARDSFGPSYIN